MSAKTRRGLTLLWIALFLCSIGMQYASLAAPATTLAADLPDKFELDGNALDSGTPGDDWEAVFNGTSGAFATAFVNDVTDQGDDIFTGGGSKDTEDISSWQRTQTSVTSVQDKNDIDHAFAAGYTAADGDLLVYFGLDRYAQNGAAQVGFWFLNKQLNPSGSSFGAKHAVGDVLVQIDFETGGTNPQARVYEWNGSGITLVSSGTTCTGIGGGDRCAISNTANSNTAWTFHPKSGANDVYQPGHFVEGGVNLTDLGLDDGCFATFFAETRSSPSEDSTLSDYAFGSFPLCAAPDITTQVRNDQGDDTNKINKGESVTDHVVVSGDKGVATGTVDFFVCGPTGSAQPCDNGGTQVSNNVALVDGAADSDPFTPTQTGWYCFRAEYTPAAGSKYLAASHTNASSECVRVIPADVQIVKTPNDGSASAGSPVSFTLSWTNEGEGKATGVVVSDDLPSGDGLDWSISGSTGTGSTCAISGAVGAQKVTCNVGSIDGNPNYPDDAPVNGTVTVTSATTAANCGAIDNTGKITSANDGTDTDPGKVTVLCPDVKVVKTPNDGQVNAGDAASFSMVVSNHGDGTATGVTLSDPLPGGLAWALGTVTGDTTGVSCAVTGSVGNQTLSCSDASMAAGESFTVTVTTTTDAAQCAAYPNVATVDATNESNDASITDDNSDAGQVTVNCPDVQALKVADKTPLNAGDEIGFTVTIKNNGTGTAYGATGSDTLPSGIAWTIDGAANGWSINAGVLSFGPADLAANEAKSVHIVGTTDAADCGLVANTVTVDATNESNAADVTDDNSATANVTVNCPDVQALKVADKTPISAGEMAAFTIEISNHGDGTAYGVSLDDTLPAGVPWHLDSVAIDGVPVADPGSLCQISGTKLTCDDLGDLAVGHTIEIAISGDTTLDSCGQLLNTVTIDATNESNAGSVTDDDTSSATVDVFCPDLAIDKDADHADPVVIGGQIGFTIEIKNNGAGTAFGVTVSDTLDPTFDWSLAAPSAGWSLVGNALSFSGNLAAGASSSVHVVAPTTPGDAAQCGLVPNTAMLQHPSIDPSSASASEQVRCPDVDLTKSADDDLVEPNQTVTYSIDVTVVDGPVTDAVVTDDLPVGQTYVTGSASPAPFSVSADGRTITWKFASLATGDPSTTITYDVTIDAAAGEAPQQNTAQVCVAEPTPCASDVAIVTPQLADIDLVKTAESAADGAVYATPAGPVTYHYVVKNTGSVALQNVTVIDDNGTPNDKADDFTATCPKTTLAVDESMTCSATVQVASDRTNIAVAHGVTAGGNAVEDQDDAKVVIQVFGLTLDKSNDAPNETLELPDGTTADLPTADEGDTVTFTLEYALADDPVTNGVLTDMLPVGLTYVAGSATSDDQFTFQSYDGTTRTLTWKAAQVAHSGSVSYQTTVDVGASELLQPLANVATVDSDQTGPDSDVSDVYVPTVPLAATATPRITLPPTDTLDGGGGDAGSPGFSLMLILLALAAFVLVVGLVTPVPASVRERSRERSRERHRR